MNFSPQQQAALDKISEWMESDRQVFYLAGYAGTGKTTLAKYVGADNYAAYTGKAAHVLRSKGCPNASTIHSLIYLPREKSAERLRELELKFTDPLTPSHEREKLRQLIEEENQNLKRPSFTLNLDSELSYSRLLVIDECSMVNADMGEDVLRFGCKVLVLGDPAQLPPVRGGGFFTSREPDVLLTEIHRQARGNPILDLATRIRMRETWLSHECLVHRKLRPEEALEADQIIVGRNRTRHNINARMRQLLGFTDPLPVPGDKVVCTRNNHRIGIMNGATYDVTEVEVGVDGRPMLKLDGNLWVTAHAEPFIGEEVNYYERLDAELFEYGYALTCHKSQGSQWDHVVVYDEGHCFRNSYHQWLYTAVTRAAKTLKVVV